MKTINSIRSIVMRIANRLTKSGTRRAEAMRKAWKLAKAQLLQVKVHGVTYSGRQENLRALASVPAEARTAELIRETSNQFDSNAVSVWCTASGKRYKLGYLPRAVASVVAALIDNHVSVKIANLMITGGFSDTQYQIFGARINVAF